MRACWAIVLVGCLATVPAFAEGVTDAKIQCQVEYGSRSEMGTACQRGVELAARTPDKLQEAMDGCTKGFEAVTEAGACQRGVGLHSRLASRRRESDESGFSYTWKQGRAPVTVDVGDYQLLLGDAEKSMDQCLRAFEGSSTPPSCLSGITAQHKPPDYSSPSREPLR
jgi:hypothetical protein